MTESKELLKFLQGLSVDQAERIHLAYNRLSASRLAVALHQARKTLSGLAASELVNSAHEAVLEASKRDTSPNWHGHWPVVGWAAEAAVYGLAGDNDFLLTAVRAGGFTK